jgi:hypothetical protein
MIPIFVTSLILASTAALTVLAATASASSTSCGYVTATNTTHVGSEVVTVAVFRTDGTYARYVEIPDGINNEWGVVPGSKHNYGTYTIAQYSPYTQKGQGTYTAHFYVLADNCTMTFYIQP